MSRCSICDFSSDIIFLGEKPRRVIFNKEFQEFRCTVCQETIHEAIFEFEEEEELSEPPY